MIARAGRLLALTIVTGILVSCGGQVHDVAFESVDHEVAECPPETAEGFDCLSITAPVAGEGTGSGSCVVFASGDNENLAKMAESGELELQAGETITWEVIVERPDNADFDGWNPVCSPMVEG